MVTLSHLSLDFYENALKVTIKTRVLTSTFLNLEVDFRKMLNILHQ